MGQEIVVTKSYEAAVCINSFPISAAGTEEPFEDEEIQLGDLVHDFNVLESGSVVFKTKPDGPYLVTMFARSFAPPTRELKSKVEELIKIEDEIDSLSERREEIWESISKCVDD